MATKCICSRPAGDANLCKPCTSTLERALAEIPFLTRELEIVLTRQTVYAPRSDGSRSATRPLPYHVAAAETGRAIRRALETAATTLLRDHAATTCPVSPRPDHTSTWLLANLNTVRYHDQAATIYRSILDPVTKARWLIDRPADRWYAGPCNALVVADGEIRECGAELYARSDHGTVTCRACDALHDVDARRDWLLAAAEDQLANAAVCARAVAWLSDTGDIKLTPTLIRMWAQRGRLVAKGHEPYPTGSDPTRTRPLYRVGDVIDLLHQATTRRTK